MQDYYKLLNVNKILIVQKTDNKEWEESDVDNYIKSCYDETIKSEVVIPREVAIFKEDKEKLALLEQVQKLCDKAYKKIGTAEGRKYNGNLQEEFNQLKETYSQINQKAETQKEMEANKYAKFREKYQQRTKRIPYNILNILKENFEKLSFSEKNELLENKKEILIKNALMSLKQSQDFIDYAEINIKMNEILEAYDFLKLQAKENRYDHSKEYQPDLIKGIVENNDSIENKIVIRQKNKETGNEKTIDENMDNQERHLTDEKRRNLKVKMLAKIGYQNIMDEKGWLYEYQVTRRVKEMGKIKEKTDIVVTPISIVEILLDKKFEQERAIDLYNFLANELFSEETIKGAQKNAGFIGSIKQDEEGNFYLTLDQNQLAPEEQEMLAATMICREKERQKNEEGR